MTLRPAIVLRSLLLLALLLPSLGVAAERVDYVIENGTQAIFAFKQLYNYISLK